jgi:hypothetical protein
VFVPYCTGDLHAGDNVAMYTANGMTVAFHHVGHANVLAYLKRLGATFTSVDQMVVSGSSAGGFGALFDYADFRRYWPTQNLSMLDDSGPPLEAGSFPDSFVMSWFQNWRLDKLTDPLCGQPCRDDLSKAVPLLIATFPNDRMALLSSLQDKTIRGFALLSATGFQTVLLQMAMDLLDPAPRFHYFFVPGETHTMLGNPNNFTQNGVPLLSWITQFATGDPAWASQKP